MYPVFLSIHFSPAHMAFQVIDSHMIHEVYCKTNWAKLDY